MRRFMKCLLIAVLLTLLLIACAKQTSLTPNNPQAVYTSAAGTANGYMTQTALVDNLLATYSASIPTPTITLIPVTVTPRPSATPLTDYKKIEYKRCGIELEIPSFFTAGEDDGRLVIYDPMYKQVPSYFWFIVNCRESFDDLGTSQFTELFVAQQVAEQLEHDGYEYIHYTEFLFTQNGYYTIYMIHRLPSEKLTYHGVTVLDRSWNFVIVDILPETTITVGLMTDAYADESVIWRVIDSIDKAK